MKFFTEESLNELQKEIDLSRVLQALGVNNNFDTPMYDCPFCSQEDCLVLNSEENKYYCFECEATGDAISLIMGGWKQSFEDAVKFLSIMFNYKVEEAEKKEPLKFRRYESLEEMSLSNIIDLIKEFKKNEKLSEEQVLVCDRFITRLKQAEENKE